MSRKRFEGKVVVVTGGTAGIGLSIAEAFGREGATIIIASRKQKNVNSAIEKLSNLGIIVYGTVCHVGKLQSVKDLIDFSIAKCKKIDILIPNAATNPQFGDIMKTEESQWDKIYEVNLKGAFFLCKYALPFMSDNGSIIFIASIASYIPSNPLPVYGIMKTALLALIKVMADSENILKRKIRVNGIAPGWIPTKFSSKVTDNKFASAIVLKNIPMKRFGKPIECASVVTFLASDDASYITGEIICVAGGQRSRL